MIRFGFTALASIDLQNSDALDLREMSRRDKRLGFIGLGKIGEALLKGFFEAGLVSAAQVIARSGSYDSTALACSKLGITAAESNAEVAARAEILIVGVKPQVLPRVLADLRASQSLAAPPLILSVVASWSTGRIEDELGAPVPVIRVMPNTPSLVRAGMSVLSPGRFATAEQLELAQSYFNGVGRSAVLEERLMDAVTGLSGSGPAYIYLVIEALAEARRQGRYSERCLDPPLGPNSLWRRADGPRVPSSPRALERCRDYARRMHRRWPPRARRRQAARDPDQGRRQSR
jgi:pyrroline-5-carboxylate reductase